METVNIHDAKTNLSKLIEGVLNGGSYVIAKAGKPVARLVPLEPLPASAKRRLDFLAGQFVVPDDFDEMAADEIRRLFEGEE